MLQFLSSIGLLVFLATLAVICW